MSDDDLQQALRDIARSTHKMNNILTRCSAGWIAGHASRAAPTGHGVYRVREPQPPGRHDRGRQAEIVLPDYRLAVALGYARGWKRYGSNYLSNALKYGGTPAAAPRVELGATVQDEG